MNMKTWTDEAGVTHILRGTYNACVTRCLRVNRITPDIETRTPTCLLCIGRVDGRLPRVKAP